MRVNTLNVGLASTYVFIGLLPGTQALPKWLQVKRGGSEITLVNSQYSVYESSTATYGGYSWGGYGPLPTLSSQAPPSSTVSGSGEETSVSSGAYTAIRPATSPATPVYSSGTVPISLFTSVTAPAEVTSSQETGSVVVITESFTVSPIPESTTASSTSENEGTITSAQYTGLSSLPETSSISAVSTLPSSYDPGQYSSSEVYGQSTTSAIGIFTALQSSSSIYASLPASSRASASVGISSATSYVTVTAGPTTSQATSIIYPLKCNHNNCLRQMIKSSSLAGEFCATYTTTVNTATTGLPGYISKCSDSPSAISSACSCIGTGSVSSSLPVSPIPQVTSSIASSVVTSYPASVPILSTISASDTSSGVGSSILSSSQSLPSYTNPPSSIPPSSGSSVFTSGESSSTELDTNTASSTEVQSSVSSSVISGFPSSPIVSTPLYLNSTSSAIGITGTGYPVTSLPSYSVSVPSSTSVPFGNSSTSVGTETSTSSEIGITGSASSTVPLSTAFPSYPLPNSTSSYGLTGTGSVAYSSGISTGASSYASGTPSGGYTIPSSSSTGPYQNSTSSTDIPLSTEYPASSGLPSISYASSSVLYPNSTSFSSASILSSSVSGGVFTTEYPASSGFPTTSYASGTPIYPYSNYTTLPGGSGVMPSSSVSGGVLSYSTPTISSGLPSYSVASRISYGSAPTSSSVVQSTTPLYQLSNTSSVVGPTGTGFSSSTSAIGIAISESSSTTLSVPVTYSSQPYETNSSLTPSIGPATSSETPTPVPVDTTCKHSTISSTAQGYVTSLPTTPTSSIGNFSASYLPSTSSILSSILNSGVETFTSSPSTPTLTVYGNPPPPSSFITSSLNAGTETSLDPGLSSITSNPIVSPLPTLNPYGRSLHEYEYERRRPGAVGRRWLW